MKKYKMYYMLLYTTVLACIVIIVSCGNPHKHKKMKMKKHKMEYRMKNDTIHTDSVRQARMKMCCGEKRKHKRDDKNKK